ncbi:MAG: glycosyltransferase family A protein [Candidatus Binataceae bacterium]
MNVHISRRRDVLAGGSRNLTAPKPAAAASAKNALAVSLLIPTKDRADELVHAVRSVLRQTLLPMEMLILDQSAANRGQECVKEEFSRADRKATKRIELRYISDTSVPGTAAARNRLLDMAQGDIALFIDDDSILEPDFIEQMTGCYADNPRIAGVSGLITNYSKPAWNALVWSSIFARGPFHDERQPLYWNAERLRGSDPIRVHKFTGASMSFRSSLIRNIRFDANLTGASREEDVDFCAMLEPQVMVIAPRARLVHNKSPVNRSRDHWLKEHVQSAHYLYRRHWKRGLRNRLCFLWLHVGYLLIIPSACLRRMSSEPWHAFRAGARRAATLTSGFDGITSRFAASTMRTANRPPGR